MNHLVNVFEYALGTFLGAMAAEWVTVRWLRAHRPHVNARNEIEV